MDKQFGRCSDTCIQKLHILYNTTFEPIPHELVLAAVSAISSGVIRHIGTTHLYREV